MSTEPTVIGVDIGTTNIKSVAFSPEGQELAKALQATPTHHLDNGRAEYRAEELWQTICGVLQDVATRLDHIGREAAAICVVGMGEAGVFLDGSGKPLYPVIPWFDERTDPQLSWWLDHVGADLTASISGVAPHSMFGVLRLLWIQQNERAAYDQATTWLNLPDYALYRLSGVQCTEWSLASRSLVFDLANRSWSDELIGAAGLRRELFADLVPAGQHVGSMTQRAALATGLREGLPVITGGFDHVCGAAAVGATKPGIVLDSIGTAEAVLTVLDRPLLHAGLWEQHLNQGAHVVPDSTWVMNGIGNGGGRIDAVRQRLGLDWKAFLAACDEPGEAHDAVESLAVDGQRLIEQMASIVQGPTRHMATGGGARNDVLMRRKRELGGRPIETPAIDEATCLGAALLAGTGVGLYASVESGRASLTLPAPTIW